MGTNLTHERTGLEVDLYPSSNSDSGYKAIISIDGLTIIKADLTDSALMSLHGSGFPEVGTSAVVWTMLKDVAEMGSFTDLLSAMKRVEEDAQNPDL